MQSFSQDFRYALRRLRKSPGFSITAILTIALGVGAVTAVFSVVQGVLLRPYDFQESGRGIVWRERIQEIQNLEPLIPDNYRHYQNLKAHSNTIQDAAILQTVGFSVSTGVDHPHKTDGLVVSPNFFSVLGVAPLLGRSFTPQEAQEGRDKEIILTWGGMAALISWRPVCRGEAPASK
jgi:MacB-like protein